ncbi:MAG: ferredoxin [Anaerofustis sp.]
MKKSIQELQEIRKKTLEKIDMRVGKEGYRIVVGMATCGIAAGARSIINKVMEVLESKHIGNVTVSQAGCIGLCRVEPIIEVIDPNGERTTYINMTPEKIERVIDEHILGGKVVKEYTITVIDNILVNPKKTEE